VGRGWLNVIAILLIAVTMETVKGPPRGVGMKLILSVLFFLASLAAHGDPYVWDDGKKFVWDKPAVVGEPKSFGEVESRRLTDSPKIYTPPRSYGEGVNNMMTEPSNSYRYIPPARSLGEGERNRLYDLR